MPVGTTDLLWALASAELWLVAGVGRLIPERLFEVARREVEHADEPGVETLELARARRIAGTRNADDWLIVQLSDRHRPSLAPRPPGVLT